MYLVKALTAAVGPLAYGEPNVTFAANSMRLVADNVRHRYAGNPAFEVVAGPAMEDCIQALLDERGGEEGGTKNGATVTADENQPVVHSTVLTCAATPISIADDADVAQYGGVKLYTFPAGLICVLGAVVDGAVTLGTTGTAIDTWAGGIALGTATATTGSTLTGTEANIMPEVDVAAATAKVAAVDSVSVATALTESGARWLDGTATAAPVFLNLVVDDDASHTAGTGSFTGTVTLTWIKLGDV